MCLPSLPKFFLVALVATAVLVTSEARSQTADDSTAKSVHVASVDTSVVVDYWRGPVIRASAYATVKVVVDDDLGNPVEGAVVTGAFSGDLMKSDEPVSGVTGPDGSVTLSTLYDYRYRVTGRDHYFTFCVDDISVSLSYSPADNVTTCDTAWFY